MDDRDLIKGTAAWLARTPVSEITPELSVTDALREVPEFLSLLAAGKLPAARFQTDERLILILRAACKVLSEPEANGLQEPLKVTQTLYNLVQGLTWPGPEFGERAEVLADCALAGWQISRALEKPAEEARWLLRFRTTAASPSPLRSEVERVLAMPLEQWVDSRFDLSLDDPELLLAVCEALRTRNEISPADSKTRAECVYLLLSDPGVAVELHDGREYFLGDLALIVGAACRFLFHRDEANRWFDRAQASFARTTNGPAHIARVAYQRLALALEERRLKEVLESAPVWFGKVDSMGLAEEGLKFRFLEGIAFRETGEISHAVTVFLDIYRQAEDQSNVRLIAQAAINLAQFYRLLGNLDEAMVYARKALPMLMQADNRVGLVKLRWAVANILREQGKPGEAIAAYREALEEAESLGLRNDAAELHLILADVLLDVGHDRQAEWEIRAALPIIDEERMAPEGFAALDLLRQALRHRQVDRKALRELHGYFGNSQT